MISLGLNVRLSCVKQAQQPTAVNLFELFGRPPSTNSEKPMIDSKLLQILRCPIDGSQLANAESELVQRLNDAITSGQLRDRCDQKITEPIQHGLVAGSTRLYPVRSGIPTLVPDEAIELKSFVEQS